MSFIEKSITLLFIELNIKLFLISLYKEYQKKFFYYPCSVICDKSLHCSVICDKSNGC